MLSPGSSISVYEVIEPIETGGMGEMYHARHEARAGVAIKALSDELVADEERVVRFDGEAKMLASRNHPNVSALWLLELEDES